MYCTHIFLTMAEDNNETRRVLDVSVYDSQGDIVYQGELTLDHAPDISRNGLVGPKTREDVIRHVTRKCEAIDLTSTVPIFGCK